VAQLQLKDSRHARCGDWDRDLPERQESGTGMQTHVQGKPFETHEPPSWRSSDHGLRPAAVEFGSKGLAEWRVRRRWTTQRRASLGPNFIQKEGGGEVRVKTDSEFELSFIHSLVS
jgi:hypothetical protein